MVLTKTTWDLRFLTLPHLMSLSAYFLKLIFNIIERFVFIIIIISAYYNLDFVIFPFSNSCLSSRRKIFPLGFFGISSTNRTPPWSRFACDVNPISKTMLYFQFLYTKKKKKSNLTCYKIHDFLFRHG